MNQSQVLETYLRVIDATIEGVRSEMQEKGTDESDIESLQLLKERWADRLTHTHDFTDDPDVIDKPPPAAKGGKKSAKGAKKKAPAPVPKSPLKTATSRNGVISVAALTNDASGAAEVSLPPVPRASPVKSEAKQDPEIIEVKDVEPPAKRPRREVVDDDHQEDLGEDLDSSDSDKGDESEDEAAENLVLAQHDRVRKGPGQKWKVILREGIVSIRGREYLFNKATCDLDF